MVSWAIVAISILLVIAIGWTGYRWGNLATDSRIGNLLMLFFLVYILADTAQLIEFDTTSGFVVEVVLVIWIVTATYLTSR
jgi:hypothetical protein